MSARHPPLTLPLPSGLVLLTHWCDAIPPFTLPSTSGLVLHPQWCDAIDRVPATTGHSRTRPTPLFHRLPATPAWKSARAMAGGQRDGEKDAEAMRATINSTARDLVANPSTPRAPPRQQIDRKRVQGGGERLADDRDWVMTMYFLSVCSVCVCGGRHSTPKLTSLCSSFRVGKVRERERKKEGGRKKRCYERYLQHQVSQCLFVVDHLPPHDR